MNFDSVTVAPYMGKDSVTPFLEYKDKWVILLALTSNIGGLDFQTKRLQNGEFLFERVLKKSLEWGDENMQEYFDEMDTIDMKIFAMVPMHLKGDDKKMVFTLRRSQSGLRLRSCGGYR